MGSRVRHEASSSGMDQFEGSSFTVRIRWRRITTTLAFNMQIIEKHKTSLKSRHDPIESRRALARAQER